MFRKAFPSGYYLIKDLKKKVEISKAEIRVTNSTNTRIMNAYRNDILMIKSQLYTSNPISYLS